MLQSFVHRVSGVNHSWQLEIKTLISTGAVADRSIAKGKQSLNIRKIIIQINAVIESNWL